MRVLIVIVFICSAAHANLRDVRSFQQTFINETLLGEGLIFQIMQDNIDAIKCVDGHRVYLKPECIVISEDGMMLVLSEDERVRLPKLYSDQYGCYIWSSMLCASCGSELSELIYPCERR